MGRTPSTKACGEHRSALADAIPARDEAFGCFQLMRVEARERDRRLAASDLYLIARIADALERYPGSKVHEGLDPVHVGSEQFVADSQSAGRGREREAPPVYDRIGKATVAIVRRHEFEPVRGGFETLHGRPGKAAQLKHAPRLDRVDLRTVDGDRVVGFRRSECIP